MDTDALKKLRVRIICRRSAWVRQYMSTPNIEKAIEVADRIMDLLETHPELLSEAIFDGAPLPDDLAKRIESLVKCDKSL